MIVTKPGPRKFVRGWAPGKDSRGPLAEKRVRLQGADSCGETDRPCDGQRVVQVLPLTHIFSVCFLAIKDQCKKCVLYKHTIKIPFNLFLTVTFATKLTVSLYLWSFGSNAPDKVEGTLRAPCQLKGPRSRGGSCFKEQKRAIHPAQWGVKSNNQYASKAISFTRSICSPGVIPNLMIFCLPFHNLQFPLARQVTQWCPWICFYPKNWKYWVSVQPGVVQDSGLLLERQLLRWRHWGAKLRRLLRLPAMQQESQS